MDHDDEDEDEEDEEKYNDNNDFDNGDEESILWRFYREKGDFNIVWPTFMDDTFGGQTRYCSN